MNNSYQWDGVLSRMESAESDEEFARILKEHPSIGGSPSDAVLEYLLCKCEKQDVVLFTSDTIELDLSRKPDAVTAFGNLRKVVGGDWDDIDPEEYVRELRAE